MLTSRGAESWGRACLGVSVTSSWSDAGYAFATALVFVLVATRLSQVPRSRESRFAHAMFALWWYGVAAFLATGGILSLLDVTGNAAQGPRWLLSALGMLTVCAAVCGLVYYVLFVYTGRSRVLFPLLAYYAGIWIVMLVGLALDPGESARWERSIVNLAILTGPLVSAAIVAFLVPALIALALYAGLYRRVGSAHQRYRVGLATTSLLTWFGLAILALALGIQDTLAWSLAGRGLALAAAGGVLLAYAPPRRVREWLDERPPRFPS